MEEEFVHVERALSLTTEAEAALTTGTTRVAARIVARASDEVRPPVEAVVCLDKSGSMAGAKLNLCKATLRLLTNELRGADKFGLVSFDHNVSVDVKLGEPVGGAIERLQSGGTTNISGALLCALDQFSNAGVRSALLLTDGHANAGITDPSKMQLAIKNANPGVQIYTFGYGSDHNSDLLRGLSADGGGYYYVDSTDRVVGAFADCLGGLLSVVAQNCKLEFRGPILRIRHDKAVQHETHWSLELGDVFGEERRDILMDVEPGEIQVEMKYLDALDATLASTTSKVVIEKVNEDDPRLPVAPAPEVVAHAARLDAADALKLAQVQADAGNFQDAQAVLKSAQTVVRATLVDQPKSDLLKRLDFDLQTCLDQTSDRTSYEKKGRHNLISKHHGHHSQRCYSDSDSDDEQTKEGEQTRNVYRGAGKKAVKSKWAQARK